ncbi:MAG: ABC transporter substrate-binding protein [Bauldia sp.]
MLAGLSGAIASAAISHGGFGQSAPVAIGALISSQNFSPYDAQMRLGLEVAIAEVNAEGGVLGRPLSLVVRDDFGDPEAATNQALEMIGGGSKIEAVVTGLLSNSRVFIDETLQGIPIPLLHAFTNEGQFCGKTTLHFGATTLQSLRPLIADLTEVPERRIFVVSENSRTGQFVLSRVLQFVRPSVVGMAQVPIDTPRTPADFSTALRRAKEGRATIVLCTMSRPTSVKLVQQAAEKGYAPGMVFAFLDFSEAQARQLPADVEVRACLPFAAADSRAQVQRFVAQAAEYSGTGLVTHVAYCHYNAVRGLVAAMRLAGRPNGQAATRFIRDLTLETPTGTLAFRGSGYSSLPMVMCRANSDGLRVVSGLPSVEPGTLC